MIFRQADNLFSRVWKREEKEKEKEKVKT